MELDAAWMRPDQERLFCGLASAYDTIVRRGTLGDVAMLHHELRGLITRGP
jgi:hypothetical protein